MTKRIVAIVAIALGAVLLLGACASAGATASSDDVQPEAEAEGDDHAEDVQVVDEHEADEPDDDGHMDNDSVGMDDEHMDDDHDDEEAPHMHVEPPHEYEDAVNPLEATEENLAAGEEIFQLVCATCHGEEGHGDGPAAESLDPKVAALADRAMMDDMSDAYLFWRVSEGGAFEPFNSAMPAWKESYEEDQIWQVILYVRSLSE